MNRPDFCSKIAAARVFALLVWMAGILWLSLTPNPPKPPDALSWDKMQHAGAYALMTLLAGRVFILFSRTPLRGWLLASVFAIFLGGLTEVAQGLMSEIRQAEFGDMLANACGSGVTLISVFAWLRLTKGRNS